MFMTTLKTEARVCIGSFGALSKAVRRDLTANGNTLLAAQVASSGRAAVTFVLVAFMATSGCLTVNSVVVLHEHHLEICLILLQITFFVFLVWFSMRASHFEMICVSRSCYL